MMGFSTPSTGKACGASPLTLACARHGRPLRRTASCGDTPLAVLPSEGCVGTLLSLLCLRRGVWGHSSRCFAFGGVCGDTPLAALPSEGCPHVLSAADVVQIASTPHAIVFAKAGKTILDTSRPTVHTPPGLLADRPGDEKARSQIRTKTIIRGASPAGTVIGWNRLGWDGQRRRPLYLGPYD